MHPTKVLVGYINQKRDGRILGSYTLMEASMTVTTNE